MLPKRGFLLAVVLICVSLAAFAQDVSISNSDGTWQSNNFANNGTTDLQLMNSTLSGVSNLMSPYNCSVCTGTVSLTTGFLTSGSIDPPANTSGVYTPAMFGPGGTFMVSDTTVGGGLTFSGSFSSESWTKHNSGTTVYWSFVGTIANSTLTLSNGMTFTGITGGTIDITTVGGVPITIATGTNKGGLQWTDALGGTTFASPVPEPSSLALFGSGLISVGVFARRKLSRKSGASTL